MLSNNSSILRVINGRLAIEENRSSERYYIAHFLLQGYIDKQTGKKMCINKDISLSLHELTLCYQDLY